MSADEPLIPEAMWKITLKPCNDPDCTCHPTYDVIVAVSRRAFESTPPEAFRRG